VETGDLGDYMRFLEKMLGERPTRIYPAHGPVVEDGVAKLREYIAHRHDRERQILEALADGPSEPMGIVRRVYAAYPAHLYGAAAQSVTQHLCKLEGEGRVARADPAAAPLDATWRAT